MSEVIAWCTFLGAWLLVAGPLYQGSAELDEMDFDREGIEGIKALAAESRPSPWWWLFPPAMYVLHRRWARPGPSLGRRRARPGREPGAGSVSLTGFRARCSAVSS